MIRSTVRFPCRFPLTAAALALVACDDGPPRDGPAPGDGPVEWRLTEPAIVSTTQAAPDGPELFGITVAMVLSGDSVVVADAALQVWVLDATGRHVRTFGRQGRGPGEFAGIDWVAEHGADSLMVYDGTLNRLSVFTRSGTFARSLQPEPRPGSSRVPRLVGAFANGTLLAVEQQLAAPPPGGTGLLRPDWVFLRYRGNAGNATYLDSLTVTTGNQFAVMEGVLMQAPVLAGTAVAVTDDAFVVATGERFEAQAFDGSGDPVGTVSESRPRIAVTDELRAVLDESGRWADLLPDSLPATTDVMVDPDGRTWLGRAGAGPVAATPWVVFSPDGAPVARVTFPEGFRPTDVGVSIVVGVRTDDVGVEHLEVYRQPGGGDGS